ncbi:MAG TPA: YbaK/EbsC family protein [Candidatus Limnocylindria bacterium]
MQPTEHANVARVRAYAAERGAPLDARRFPAGTRTAEDAARAIGVTVGQIVKSLVFRAGDATLVVLCSGSHRVDEPKLAAAAGVASIRRASANEAKEATGYAIGGVPPFAHATPCRVLCDELLMTFDVVWAAAGLPDAVFPIAPADLVRLSGASVVDVAA